MQVQKLRQILNTTRPIADYGKYIAVGSQLCHDLISVDKETFSLKYALNIDKSAPVGNAELMGIWTKLEELIKTGELKDIQHIQNTAELLNKMQKLLMAGEPFKVFEATEAFSLPRPVL